MVQVADKSPAQADRFPLRVRPDLSIRELMFGKRRMWVIKDPITLKYFHLREEEYSILGMLDGRTNLQAIQQKFERQHVPQKLSLQQLQGFLGVLHGRGLLVSDIPGQSHALYERHRRVGRVRRFSALSNLIAIRVRGIDPDRFLNWLYPQIRWLYSPSSITACLVFVLTAVLLATVHFDVLMSRLPAFHVFFSTRNLVWLVLAMVVAKTLHELGHALTCKHFGGECHEMGIMFLAFTPCLYCNVSDAWMLPSRWQRVAVGAAGMFVELVLAALCTFLWWFTVPGFLNSLCLNMVFVCSVGTLLFNANPLLRFDGYYIPTDLAEVPNLRHQSNTIVRNRLARWFLGVEAAAERMLPAAHRPLLAVYSVLSSVYRWFVVVGILWFMHAVLEPYGLAAFVQLMAVMIVSGLILVPCFSFVRFVRDPAIQQQLNRRRFLVRGGLVAAVAVAGIVVPVPHRIVVPVMLEPLVLLAKLSFLFQPCRR